MYQEIGNDQQSVYLRRKYRGTLTVYRIWVKSESWSETGWFLIFFKTNDIFETELSRKSKKYET